MAASARNGGCTRLSPGITLASLAQCPIYNERSTGRENCCSCCCNLLTTGLVCGIGTAMPSHDCKPPNMSFKESSGRVLQRDSEFNKVAGGWKNGLICHCKINGLRALLLTVLGLDGCFSRPTEVIGAGITAESPVGRFNLEREQM